MGNILQLNLTVLKLSLYFWALPLGNLKKIFTSAPYKETH